MKRGEEEKNRLMEQEYLSLKHSFLNLGHTDYLY